MADAVGHGRFPALTKDQLPRGAPPSTVRGRILHHERRSRSSDVDDDPVSLATTGSQRLVMVRQRDEGVVGGGAGSLSRRRVWLVIGADV